MVGSELVRAASKCGVDPEKLTPALGRQSRHNPLANWAGHTFLTGSVRQVLQKAVMCLGSSGVAQLDFLVFLEIVHVEVAMGLEPVLVSLDGEGSDEAATGG